MTVILKIFHGFFETVHEINEKYKEPQIKMTRGVKWVLLMLRLYLLFTVAILLIKFISVAMSGGLRDVP